MILTAGGEYNVLKVRFLRHMLLKALAAIGDMPRYRRFGSQN